MFALFGLLSVAPNVSNGVSARYSKLSFHSTRSRVNN